jgi:hypothetical protein
VAHVELAHRGAGQRTVRLAVDHEPAHAADPLAAIVVERDRILAAPRLNREPLEFEYVHLAQRSYK